MRRFKAGWQIQTRVLSALMIRELSTRFGRENIGFLWVMVEPLLFAVLVGFIWRSWRGADEHGIGMIAFVATGYLPLTMFRHSISRSAGIFRANGSLLYHQQIKILDLVLVRFFIEMIGTSMAYVFIGTILVALNLMPVPYDMGDWLIGWFLYGMVTLSICMVIAPISERSEVIEKLIPVTTYVMVPFSGTFVLNSWVAPNVREFLLWSPMVTPMELMRHGIFGSAVTPYVALGVPLTFSLVFFLLGLVLCRRARRTLIVE